jgi:hypothetical protein
MEDYVTWLKKIIGTEKAVVGMCHLKALPGDLFPTYRYLYQQTLLLQEKLHS